MQHNLPYTIWVDKNGQEVRILATKPNDRMYSSWKIDLGKEHEIPVMNFARPYIEIPGSPDQNIAQKNLNDYAEAQDWIQRA
jgi:hypothetical protein